MRENQELVNEIMKITGSRYCLTGRRQTERFRRGFRSGYGEAVAVAIPGTLVEMWGVLKAAHAGGAIIIMQAANTGLTEGSTPNGSYDRPVVIISTLRLDGLYLLKDGAQVVSLPGATLFKLEAELRALGRTPHSIIGSSCLGASIVGGVCNNSGGSLVRRGPVYTELSLLARISANNELELINHLGLDLGQTPEEMLGRLDRGEISDAIIQEGGGRSSDDTYAQRVRDVDATTPSRFNADPRGLYEASGSAGKVAVFAVRLDTFEAEADQKVYYIGTNDTGALTELRRRLLTELPELPVSGEYLHRDCFDMSARYGKDTVLMIERLGTDRLPYFFALKGKVDAALARIPFIPRHFSDRLLQALSRLAPRHLPERMVQFRDRYEHHLILKVAGATTGQTENILHETVGDGWFACTKKEESRAMLHRFAAAGAAVRYGAVHGKGREILALDIALRRNDRDWFEKLPEQISEHIEKSLYYGHFLCHVLHQDYVLKPGTDAAGVKAAMLELLDKRGAEYPAEHNVGHLYKAKPALAGHYQNLDPLNAFNPGIGKTSRARDWKST